MRRRELVVTWLNRGTLHLVHRDDHAWLLSLTAPTQMTGNARRLRQEGVRDPEAALGRFVSMVADGPVPSRGLAIPGVPPAGCVHVAFLAALRGLVVRGGPDGAYVLTEDWLGPQPAVDREKALAELGRRYAASHADFDDHDLAKWAGLPLRDARAALRSTKRVATTHDVEQPKLLGAFDEALMGWKDRSWVLGGHDEAVISGGIFRPTILLDGRIVGTWGYVKGRVALRPAEPVDETRLAGEVAAVEAFLGG